VIKDQAWRNECGCSVTYLISNKSQQIYRLDLVYNLIYIANCWICKCAGHSLGALLIMLECVEGQQEQENELADLWILRPLSAIPRLSWSFIGRAAAKTQIVGSHLSGGISRFEFED
jgi:hypothetical protein